MICYVFCVCERPRNVEAVYTLSLVHCSEILPQRRREELCPSDEPHHPKACLLSKGVQRSGSQVCLLPGSHAGSLMFLQVA